jgi:hypothetical protein
VEVVVEQVEVMESDSWKGGGGAGGYSTSFPGGTKLTLIRIWILSNNSWSWRSRSSFKSWLFTCSGGGDGNPSIISTITSAGGGGGGSPGKWLW